MYGSYFDSIAIDVTNQCNFRCRHCFNYSGDQISTKPPLSDQELMILADEVIQFCPSTVCMCGGEPFTKSEFILEYAKYLKRGGIPNVNVVSNGYLIDKNMAKQIHDAGIYYIQVSVDGFSSDAHDWLRNMPGSFNKVMSAIDNLVENNLHVGVACTPTKKNINEVEKLIDVLYQKGVKSFRMQPIMKLGRAKDIVDHFPSPEEHMKLSMLIRNLKADKKYDGMDFEWGDPIDHLCQMREGGKIRAININSYGDLLLSPYIPISFGNITKHRLSEYVDAKLMDLPEHYLVQKLCSLITSELDMDLSECGILPELYRGDPLSLDIIDSDIEYESSILVKKMGLDL